MVSTILSELDINVESQSHHIDSVFHIKTLRVFHFVLRKNENMSPEKWFVSPLQKAKQGAILQRQSVTLLVYGGPH